MHVAIVAVFDPSTVPGGYSYRRIRQLLNDRIPQVPVFQRRLVEVPMRLGFPVWVDDPEFDIDNHLRRAALPSPGGMRELAEFAGDVISRQLHRDRPLWEMWIVEGLKDGKIALVVKMHHSTIDGVSGAELLGCSSTSNPNRLKAAHLTERQLDSRIPSGFELVSQAMISGLVAPFEVGRMVLRTDAEPLRHPGHTTQRAGGEGGPAADGAADVDQRGRARSAAGGLRHGEPGRRQASQEQDGHDRQRRGAGHLQGALRSYLLAGDELPEIPLVSVVPVSVTPRHGPTQGVQQGLGHVRAVALPSRGPARAVAGDP